MGKIRSRGLGLLSLLLAMLMLPLRVSAGEHTEDMAYACKVYNGSHQMIGQMEDGLGVTVLADCGIYYKVDCYDMVGYIPKTQISWENGRYYVNCNPESKDTVPLEYVSLGEALSLRSDLLETAKSKLGCAYVYATAGPNTFDCSGLTSYIYASYGYTLERTARHEIMDGIIVSKDSLQVGDLIFYRDRQKNGIGHVAMYAGDGQIIHADSRGVRYTDMDDGYYAERYVCARRVINVRPIRWVNKIQGRVALLRHDLGESYL